MSRQDMSRWRNAKSRITATRACRWVGALLASIAVFSGTAAAAGSGWSPTPGHLARTLAHLIGIVGGLVLVYYTDDIRRKTRGSTVGKSSLLAEIGTGLFVLVFLDMEAGHALGIDLWYFAGTMHVAQTWWMIALALVLVLYTLSYRTLTNELGA